MIVAIPPRRLFAFAELTEPVHLRWRDVFARQRDHRPARVAIATAEGWRPAEEHPDPLSVPVWEADCVAGDVVRIDRDIRLQDNWRWSISYYVIDREARLHQISPGLVSDYLKRRREFLRRLEAGEGRTPCQEGTKA